MISHLIKFAPSDFAIDTFVELPDIEGLSIFLRFVWPNPIRACPEAHPWTLRGWSVELL